MFEEAEFDIAFQELECPNLEGYEFFTETKDITIYRKYHHDSGLYEYKTSGFLDCRAEICQKVYMDLDYRKTWDKYVFELHEVIADCGPVIYWNVNFPFPMSNRDYVFVRECRKMTAAKKATWVILARSHPVPSLPPRSKITRVDNYKQLLVIQEYAENRTKAFMHYYDNPGGLIPRWLINWAAKTGVPAFLEEVKRACVGYPEHLKIKDR